jgi:hypothetical protein
MHALLASGYPRPMQPRGGQGIADLRGGHHQPRTACRERVGHISGHEAGAGLAVRKLGHELAVADKGDRVGGRPGDHRDRAHQPPAVRGIGERGARHRRKVREGDGAEIFEEARIGHGLAAAIRAFLRVAYFFAGAGRGAGPGVWTIGGAPPAGAATPG